MAAKEKVDAAKLEEYLERCDFPFLFVAGYNLDSRDMWFFGFDAY